MNSILDGCKPKEFTTTESIVFYISTSLFYIIIGLPCIKLIFDKTPNTKNISIIPGLSSYFLVSLYLGYHIVTYDEEKKLIVDIFQLIFILLWNFIYIWYSSLKQILKVINKCVLLLGVGFDTIFIGYILNVSFNKDKEKVRNVIDILRLLPNSLMFFLTLQWDTWKKKRYESINIWASICGIIHAASCIIMLALDWEDTECSAILLIPNIIGFCVSIAYTVIYFVLRCKKNYEHTRTEY